MITKRATDMTESLDFLQARFVRREGNQIFIFMEIFVAIAPYNLYQLLKMKKMGHISKLVQLIFHNS